MGILWSFTSQPNYIDGLEFPSNVKRDFNARDAAEKVEQLLRASVNSYRLSPIAPPITAAYFLGADPKMLTRLYEKWVVEMCTDWPEDDPIADSIGKFNLDEFYGEDRYEQRYYEYFRDCLTEESDWSKMAMSHMDQLWARLSRNDMRPLIELAAGVEMDNGMIISEALAMACTDPEGSIVIDETGTDQNGSMFALKFRKLAQRALKLEAYLPVVGLHACAEIFLKSGLHLLSEQREIAILDALDRHIAALEKEKAHKRWPTVEPAEALASEDPYLVTFTRSRLVLKYLAT